MAVNKVPVLKRCRTLGINPIIMGIDKKSRRKPNQSNKKMSEYAIQLREKQKAKFIYGVLEKPFRRYFEKAKNKEGITGHNLMIRLESRMDNVVFRMGLAATRREARQMIVHGHFTLNNKKITIPSIEIHPGDVIKVKDKSKSLQKFKEVKDMIITVPEWLTFDVDKLEGSMVAKPRREEIDTPIEEHYIVELYSK